MFCIRPVPLDLLQTSREVLNHVNFRGQRALVSNRQEVQKMWKRQGRKCERNANCYFPKIVNIFRVQIMVIIVLV